MKDDDQPPLPLDVGDAERVGRPPRNSADDGKSGGQSQGGKLGTGTVHAAAGENFQRGGPSGTENELNAPGMSTDKKGDDTK